MELKELHVPLYCIKCLNEEMHTLIYVNDHLYKIRCEGCHRKMVIQPDFRKEIYSEYLNRILTKPERISKELKEDLRRFVTMPYRVVSKPYRIYKELKGIRRFISEQKGNGMGDDRSKIG